MYVEHPNLALLSKLNLLDLDASSALFSNRFVWHYINPKLPEIQGDYVGVAGLKMFFEKLAGTTKGTFKVDVVSTMPVGDELVVIHVRDSMVLDEKTIRVDAVVIWRVVNGQFVEAWDIPSAYTLAT